MATLNFDHLIHYVDHLNQFHYPGQLLKLEPGGKHHRYGTFNRLTYLNDNYIELLDVEQPDKLAKEVKSEEGRVSFAAKIIQDYFAEGFKGICLRTTSIEETAQRLCDKNVDTIGPIRMHRENKKGEQIDWQLLYIADPDYLVKPPFFIQWNETETERKERFARHQQSQFVIEKLVIASEKRAVTVKKWQLWYDMDIIADNDKYTDLVLKDDNIIFRIQDGKKSEYASIVIQDHEASSPYNMTIRGATYRFINGILPKS